MIRVFEDMFGNVYDAAMWVIERGTPTGDSSIEIVDDGYRHIEYVEPYRFADGSEVSVVWAIPIEYEHSDLADWPWDNGTASVVVDGCNVEEVA